MDHRRILARSFVLLVVAASGSAAFAQQAAPPAGDQDAAPAPTTETQAVAPERFDDPYAAYASGNWEQALEGFVDQQVEHPENSEVALNLGSVHYEMKDYEEAERHFASAVLSGDPGVRNQALFNLGNSAYRQGKLQEAVELYMAALEADPDDEDAKFNLEFVRDEIRRRHEEAQKRQQEQQQEGDQQQQQQQQGDDQQQQQQQQQPQDRDGDGLPDELERTAQNPTDPENPDSDNDGLADGQEDQNRSGQVDEGETDPNNPDSDGDGVSDGEEAEQQEQQGSQGEEPPEDEEGLTPEEAERYLQALEEGRPDQRRAPKGTRRARPEKDW
ncbi:MAG: tetratricopeptide repeat protein [bacterium]|nr:tetratricopeptide repeat protein [bacterium]